MNNSGQMRRGRHGRSLKMPGKRAANARASSNSVHTSGQDATGAANAMTPNAHNSHEKHKHAAATHGADFATLVRSVENMSGETKGQRQWCRKQVPGNRMVPVGIPRA